jgi:hypothetical protein
VPQAQSLTPEQLKVQRLCSEGAQMLHDVQWAAVCELLAKQGEGDGDADCDLPPSQASRLYEQLSQSEQQCAVDARASTR